MSAPRLQLVHSGATKATKAKKDVPALRVVSPAGRLLKPKAVKASPKQNPARSSIVREAAFVADLLIKHRRAGTVCRAFDNLFDPPLGGAA